MCDNYYYLARQARGCNNFEVFDRPLPVPYNGVGVIGEEVPKDQLGVVEFELVVFEYSSQKALKDFNAN